jgi:organic hydroperoxide reductase OsmC/OhrA
MLKIAPFPHHYTVSFSRGVLSAVARPSVPAGAPPQFGGKGDVWSPEDLLVAAVLTCFRTTFDSFAARGSLAVHDWRGVATGVLDKGPAGPVFTSIKLTVEVEVSPGDEEKTRALLAAAERHCIVSRALNAPVEVTAQVTAIVPSGDRDTSAVC